MISICLLMQLKAQLLSSHRHKLAQTAQIQVVNLTGRLLYKKHCSHIFSKIIFYNFLTKQKRFNITIFIHFSKILFMKKVIHYISLQKNVICLIFIQTFISWKEQQNLNKQTYECLPHHFNESRLIGKPLYLFSYMCFVKQLT